MRFAAALDGAVSSSRAAWLSFPSPGFEAHSPPSTAESGRLWGRGCQGGLQPVLRRLDNVVVCSAVLLLRGCLCGDQLPEVDFRLERRALCRHLPPVGRHYYSGHGHMSTAVTAQQLLELHFALAEGCWCVCRLLRSGTPTHSSMTLEVSVCWCVSPCSSACLPCKKVPISPNARSWPQAQTATLHLPAMGMEEGEQTLSSPMSRHLQRTTCTREGHRIHSSHLHHRNNSSSSSSKRSHSHNLPTLFECPRQQLSWRSCCCWETIPHHGIRVRLRK